MKKFSFALESLLKIRMQKVNVLQADLASLRQEEGKIRIQCELLKKEKNELEERLQQMRFLGEIRYQEDFFMYSTHLDQLIVELERQGGECQKKIFLQQEDLLKALKERKIVEKLKEKQYSQWQQKALSQTNAFD